MSQKRYQSISERFCDVLEGPIDDFMVKFQWDSGFSSFLNQFWKIENIYWTLGVPQSRPRTIKTPEMNAPRCVDIYRYNFFYLTPKTYEVTGD